MIGQGMKATHSFIYDVRVRILSQNGSLTVASPPSSLEQYHRNVSDDDDDDVYNRV